MTTRSKPAKGVVRKAKCPGDDPVVMAPFPEQNPNPVLRMGRDGEIVYANPSARELLEIVGWEPGRPGPEVLWLAASAALSRGQRHTLDVHLGRGRIHSFTCIPLEDGRVNLYGHDVTEVRRAVDERERTIELLRRAEETLLESNRRLELLSETASRLLLSEDPQGIVQSLCESVMAAIDCHVFFNFLVDEQAGRLHLNAHAGIPDDLAASIEWLEYGVAVCGCVAKEGRRIVAEDILNRHDPRTELVKGYGVQAYACNPLLAQGGRVIGTLSFGSRTKVRFTDGELELMKAVADQVATAMERIRLLAVERQRAEELNAVLDSVPAAVWIAHDTESRRITGNRLSSELLHVPFDANISKTAPPGEAHTHFNALNEGKEIPLPMLPVQRAARGEFIRDYELDLEFDGGEVRHFFGNAAPLFDAGGRPRGSVGAFVDVTERRRAEQRQHELEAQQLEFSRRLVKAATGGRLEISGKTEILALAKNCLGRWEVAKPEDLAALRRTALEIAQAHGLPVSQAFRLACCIGEAASNALKHARSGDASLWLDQGSLLFVVEDAGGGIHSLNLPDVALTRGYSTAGTGGLGYELMIKCADKVYLATGPEGTTVAIRLDFHAEAAAPSRS